jgi:hypothetical protein
MATRMQISSKVTVLLLCHEGDEEEAVAQSLVDAAEEEMIGVHAYRSFTELYLPDPPLKHAVVDIPSMLLMNITQEAVKIDPLKVIDDFKKRQIPRFR